MDELQEARQALEALLKHYLVERDKEKTIACLAEDLYSVGTGGMEVAQSRDEFAALLKKEMEETPNSFSLDWKFLRGKCRDGCAEFLGQATVSGCLEGETVNIEARFTAVMRRVDGVFKASSLHMSTAAETQETEEFFPVRFAERTIAEIRDEMKQRALDILSTSIPGGMMGGYLEPGWPLYFVNSKMLEYLGYTYDDFVRDIGGLVINCMHPDDRSYVEAVVDKNLRECGQYEVQYRMRRQNGDYLWILDRGKRIQTPEGRDAILSVCIDITNSVLMQKELEEKTARLEENNREMQRQQYFTSLLMSSNTMGMVIVYDDPVGSFAYVGDNLIRFLGYEKDEFQRRFSNMRQLIHQDDWLPQREALLKQLQSSDFYKVEYRVFKKGGSQLWVQEQGQRSTEDSGRGMFICTLLDISQHKRRQAQLERESERDSLTGVLNRGAGIRHVGEYLERKPAQEACALFLLDMDNFKRVNDTFGHMTGDQVLIHLGTILNAAFRKNDIVFRLGGDEFVVLMMDVRRRIDLEKKAANICERVRRTLDSRIRLLGLSVSMGIAVAEDTVTFETLYEMADTALYDAKCKGKDCYRILPEELTRAESAARAGAG